MSHSTDLDDDYEKGDSGSETNLTEPDDHPCGKRGGGSHQLRGRSVSRQTPTLRHSTDSKEAFSKNIHSDLYKNPADNMNKNLSAISKNYEQSGNIKKLQIWLQNYWHQLV